MQPLNVVLYGALVHGLEGTLRNKLGVPANITRLKEDAPQAQLAAAFAEAQVVIALSYRNMPPAPRLALLQAPGAGMDQIAVDEVPEHAAVCNAYGHEVAGAEYALLGMLAWTHQLIEAHESFRGGSWRMSGRYGAPAHEELSGKTVGVLGLGPIGMRVAKLAKQLDTVVVGCNRTLRPRPAHLDRQYPLEQLHDFLHECDFVVVSIALVPQTVDLLDHRAFAAMKRGSVLVNIARGAVVNEDALYTALKERRIAGAVIDAWYQYPPADDLQMRPSKHPFHELPNVIMTPHSSIWTRGMIERRWDQIARNIEAVAHGRPLVNVVRKAGTAKQATQG